MRICDTADFNLNSNDDELKSDSIIDLTKHGKAVLNGTEHVSLRDPELNETADHNEKHAIATVTTHVAVPPDGGWGWVIVAASFFCNLIVDGTIYTFSMFLTEITRHFGEDNAKVSLIGSLLSGSYLITGPFASALANRYGFRLVTIVGAVISSSAFFLSSYATSVDFLYVTYGIFGGIGFGLIFVPAVITIGFYFEKWRALATGIAVCGSGIGVFVMAPLTEWLIQRLNWDGAMMVQAGIILHCALCGALFRPLKTVSVKVPVHENLETTNQSLISKTEILRKSKDKSASLLNVYEDLNINMIKAFTKSADRMERNHFESPELKKRNSVIPEMRILLNRKYSLQPYKSKSFTVSSTSMYSRKNSKNDFGNSKRLLQYTSQSSALDYTMSVTRLSTYTDILKKNKKKCAIFPEAIRRTLATMLDFSLLKSFTFNLLAISGLFTSMGMNIPYMLTKTRAEKYGIAEETMVMMISVLGIANMVGRIGFGVLSSIPKMNAVFISNAALTVCGLCIAFSGLTHLTEYQFLYVSAFGLTIASFSSLRTIIVVDLLGLEKLTNAFGLLLLFQGIGAIIGPPMAAYFQDVTDNYEMPFYISGGLIVSSAIMCYPIAALNRWETNKTIKNVQSDV